MGDSEEDALHRAVRALSRRDPVLRRLARRWGAPTFRSHEDHYQTLVHSIVGQQISGMAARSILERLRAGLGGEFLPETMAAAPDEVFRGAGVSPQKLGYLRSLTGHVLGGSLELTLIARMPDEEVLAALTAVKGIGDWTAHMFLIFSLARLDVLPSGDLGVRKGTQTAYGLPELPTPREIEVISMEHRWSPYRSVASWYMWRALET